MMSVRRIEEQGRKRAKTENIEKKIMEEMALKTRMKEKTYTHTHTHKHTHTETGTEAQTRTAKNNNNNNSDNNSNNNNDNSDNNSNNDNNDEHEHEQVGLSYSGLLKSCAATSLWGPLGTPGPGILEFQKQIKKTKQNDIY